VKDYCNKSDNTSKKLQEHGIYKHLQIFEKNAHKGLLWGNMKNLTIFEKTQKIGKMYKKGTKRERNNIVQPNQRREVAFQFDELRCCDP
jgi:DNA helicase IV